MRITGVFAELPEQNRRVQRKGWRLSGIALATERGCTLGVEGLAESGNAIGKTLLGIADVLTELAKQNSGIKGQLRGERGLSHLSAERGLSAGIKRGTHRLDAIGKALLQIAAILTKFTEQRRRVQRQLWNRGIARLTAEGGLTAGIKGPAESVEAISKALLRIAHIAAEFTQQLFGVERQLWRIRRLAAERRLSAGIEDLADTVQAVSKTLLRIAGILTQGTQQFRGIEGEFGREAWVTRLTAERRCPVGIKGSTETGDTVSKTLLQVTAVFA